MYTQFFGLQKSPFNLTSDPEFLYLTGQHREALAGLTYAILARKGCIVLTGNAGTGKTTLLARILEHLPVSRIQSSVIVNPTLTPAEFLEATLMGFGIHEIPASKAQRIAMLQGFLLMGNRDGKIAALIVDEAHKLSVEVIEEIRLLGNFESSGQKLLQTVLVGQSELDALLNSDALRQFKQRISLRLTLEPLAAAEIDPYIRYRWMKAGGGEAPFSAAAIAGIGQVSRGVPRVVNVLCDNSLMRAFGEDSASVEVRHLLAVCRELQFADSIPEIAAAPLPPPTAPVVEAFQMKTLERYAAAAARPSLLARLVDKIKLKVGLKTKLKQRIETA